MRCTVEFGAVSKAVIGFYSSYLHTDGFEKDFARFINRKFCVMVNSGSAANLISVASFFYTKNPMLKKKIILTSIISLVLSIIVSVIKNEIF